MRVNQSILLKALQIANRAVAKTTAPATEYFQFTLSGNILHIAACNLKFYIKVDVEIQSEGTNSFLIHAKKLLEYIVSLPDQPLTFTIDKNVTVKYSNGKFNMPILNDDNFPTPTPPKTKNTMLINSDVFNEGIYRTSWARENDRPDKPALECLKIDLQPGKLTFVGASAGAMSAYTLEADHNVTGEVLIPPYCLEAFNFDPDKQLAIITDGDRLSISYDNVFINTVVFGESYPDISGHLALTGDKVAVVDKQALSGSLKRIKSFAGGENNTVKLSFNGSLNLYAKSLDGSEEVDESIEIDYNGESFEILTNAAILLNAASRLESINMSMSSNRKPIVIRQAPDSQDVVIVSPVAY